MPTGTILWGSTPWGTSGSFIGSGAVLDAQSCVSDAVYRLGFSSPSEIASVSWVTLAELYQWADEAAKELAYEAGVFLTEDTSITSAQGTATYELPSTHVFALAAWLGAQALRITAVRDLWALDANWVTTSGNATRCSFDAGGVGTVTLYPNPVTGGDTLAQICQEIQGTLAAGSSTIALPTVLQDFFTYAMLAGARGKESEAAMPEMAAHFEGRLKLYEQVIEHLWGPGQ
jgi:hypothetical protein